MARESNEQIDRLLRRVFKTDPATAPVEDCPDAEVLAAWADGRLTGPMQSAAVSHLSTCPRCQAIVAELARMQPVAEEPKVWWRRGLRVWLVPVTAAAAAVVIWLVVPSTPPSIDQFETRQAARQAESEPQAPVTPRAPEAPPASPAQSAPAARSPAERRRAQAAPPAVALESPAEPQPAQAAPSAAALESPAAAPAARDQRADLSADRAVPMKAEAGRRIGATVAGKELPPFTVASPDRSVAWRIEPDGAIARSSDGGATWDAVADGLGVNLLAGASPSPNVCWLVGRGGAVLLTIDGRRFTRLPFPDNGDLVAVQATDGRIAQVTASGGRIFRTTDGGRTWAEARPQDF